MTQKFLTELIELVHNLTDVISVNVVHTADDHPFGHIPQINRGGLALTCGVCSADLNVESVAKVAVNATLKVNCTDSVVGTEALAKGVLLGITRALRFSSFL